MGYATHLALLVSGRGAALSTPGAGRGRALLFLFLHNFPPNVRQPIK